MSMARHGVPTATVLARVCQEADILDWCVITGKSVLNLVQIFGKKLVLNQILMNLKQLRAE